jgi:hypothetical protein
MHIAPGLPKKPYWRKSRAPPTQRAILAVTACCFSDVDELRSRRSRAQRINELNVLQEIA